MKRLLAVMLCVFSFSSVASDYQTTLLVQTGQLRESDLIVRTVSDLESNRICLAFYIRTTGTSPVISCYDGRAGFRSNVEQVGHFKEGKLIIRKLTDSVNGVSCSVAYISTPGTSPAINCYSSSADGSKYRTSGAISSSGHLREGDMDVYRVVDPDSSKTCIIAYVDTQSTSPAQQCYSTPAVVGAAAAPLKPKGALVQTNYMREGDLIVRKVVDHGNRKECLITYVSTEGTKPYIHCAEERSTPVPGNAR
jgi:hypothetical protein